MVNIRARSSWTNTAPAGGARSNSATTHFVIHYPAMGSVVGASMTEQQVIQRLNQWRQQHVNQGWGDIGYNYAVDQAGRVWELRGLRVGAQARNFNSSSIGVLLVVGNTERPTDACVRAVHELWSHLRRTLPNMTHMVGHGQAPGQATACPGPVVMPTLNAFRYTPPKVASHEDLRVGSRGENVRALQQGLNRVFPSYQHTARVKAVDPRAPRLLETDGIFGPITQSWVKEFQHRTTGVASGVVDQVTHGKLQSFGVRF